MAALRLRLSFAHTALKVTIVRSNSTVLISGASFAGLATAWWMARLGYRVTVVEIAKDLRKGGTPVDIREDVVDVVRRMGLLERIAAKSLPPRSIDFLDARGEPAGGAMLPSDAAQDANDDGWEIERDALLDLLFEEIGRSGVELRFGESIVEVHESADAVDVVFASGRREMFSLLFGCDGTHSFVRRICFGEESSFVLFLQMYFSLSIVDKLLVDEDSSKIVSAPGKTIIVNAYNGKTDVAFCFRSEREIAFDRGDEQQQKALIFERFEGNGWRTSELLDEMRRSRNFYFDKLCQVRMDAWSRGRVALVGDAGYCPSPAAGLGGSMALLGAAALGDAFERYPDDHRMAFQAYDDALRPSVEKIQRDAVEMALRLCAPD